jgi:DNA repair protein RecO (recombination protein O)
VKQILTKGIILSRTDYGEADRILTVLTPDHGKLRLMARGVRRVKSKLAGGIELFSVSDLTYMPGKGDLGTLISSRLDRHYGDIVRDITRVQLGYELIKQLNRATEDEPEPDYFNLLNAGFEALNNPVIDPELIKIWFQAQLLKLSGRTPNLHTDIGGGPLDATRKYNFDFDNMAFVDHPAGRFLADHIKVLRLLLGDHRPVALGQVQGLDDILPQLRSLLQTIAQTG